MARDHDDRAENGGGDERPRRDGRPPQSLELAGLALAHEADRELAERRQQDCVREHPAGEVGVSPDQLATQVDGPIAGGEDRVEHHQ
jgi:hypothetical protein